MQNFATAAEIVAVVDIAAGNIRFVAGDKGEATVEVRPADASKGRDVKAAEEVEVGYADGVLRIATPAARNRVLGNSGVVEVGVRLPAGSRVEAKTAAGELLGTGRLGNVVFEGAAGPVRLDEIAGGRIVLQAGSIAVGRLGDTAEIRTQKGDIDVAEAVRGTVTLRTEAGGITVGAARGTSATLDARTAFGRIANGLGNTEGADAGLRIHADTSYGDITARCV
ncbi:hypothetical protein [Streptomyces sp. NPDC093089]|uniref:hypothetical protein n=1 Tax=Streptomyces sp. NPDC093089 TaxID=3366024 RepID=UPI00380A8873